MGAKSGKFMTTTRLDGKTAVITGCNTGIGKITAKELYRIGGRVVMACRDVTRATQAMDDIKSELSGVENTGELVVKKLDLNSLQSVRECAQDIIKDEKNIHILINNAGIMMVPKGKTEDGFELNFGVNHLGHFLFTCLLLPTILKSTPARIINVSSRAHTDGQIDWDDLNWERRTYSPFKAYAQSKLCNVLFTVELANRLKGKGVTVYSLHPGIVKTELGRHLDETYFSGARKLAAIAFAPFSITPEQGALTTLHCALDEKAGEETGLYYSDSKVKEASAAARDEQLAAKLWQESAKLVNLKPDEGDE